MPSLPPRNVPIHILKKLKQCIILYSTHLTQKILLYKFVLFNV